MRLTKNKGLLAAVICSLAYHITEIFVIIPALLVNVFSAAASGFTMGSRLAIGTGIFDLFAWTASLGTALLTGAALMLEEKRRRKGACIVSGLQLVAPELLIILGGMILCLVYGSYVWRYSFISRVLYVFPIRIVLMLYILCRNKSSVLWKIVTPVALMLMLVPGFRALQLHLSAFSMQRGFYGADVFGLLKNIYDYAALNVPMVLIYLFGIVFRRTAAAEETAPPEQEG